MCLDTDGTVGHVNCLALYNNIIFLFDLSLHSSRVAVRILG